MMFVVVFTFFYCYVRVKKRKFRCSLPVNNLGAVYLSNVKRIRAI